MTPLGTDVVGDGYGQDVNGLLLQSDVDYHLVEGSCDPCLDVVTVVSCPAVNHDPQLHEVRHCPLVEGFLSNSTTLAFAISPHVVEDEPMDLVKVKEAGALCCLSGHSLQGELVRFLLNHLQPQG